MFGQVICSIDNSHVLPSPWSPCGTKILVCSAEDNERKKVDDFEDEAHSEEALFQGQAKAVRELFVVDAEFGGENAIGTKLRFVTKMSDGLARWDLDRPTVAIVAPYNCSVTRIGLVSWLETRCFNILHQIKAEWHCGIYSDLRWDPTCQLDTKPDRSAQTLRQALHLQGLGFTSDGDPAQRVALNSPQVLQLQGMGAHGPYNTTTGFNIRNSEITLAFTVLIYAWRGRCCAECGLVCRAIASWVAKFPR